MATSLILGLNLAFSTDWREATWGYAAYLAFERGAVLDWDEAIGIQDLTEATGNRSAFLPFSMRLRNHGVSVGVGMRNAVELWGITPDYPGAASAIVGAGWSEISEPVAAMGDALGGVQIDYISTSPALSSKTDYPFFVRVCGPDSAWGVAMRKLLITLGIRTAAALFGEAEGPTSAYERMLQTTEADQMLLRIEGEQMSSASLRSPASSPVALQVETQWRQSIRKVMTSGYRIILLIATRFDEEDLRILRVARDEHLCGPQFLWLWGFGMQGQGSSHSSTAAFTSRRLHLSHYDFHDPPTQDNPGGGLQAFKGALLLCIEPGPRKAALEDFIGNLTPQDFPEPMRTHMEMAEVNQTTPDRGSSALEAGRIFDAVAIFLMAAGRLLQQSRSIEEIRGQLLLDALRGVAFEGAAGDIRLNDHLEVEERYGLGNLVIEDELLDNSTRRADQQWVHVATSDLYGNWSFAHPIIYPDGGNELPPDMVICPPGSSWRAEANGQPGCHSCPIGTYGIGGALPCTLCSNGTFQPEPSQSVCFLAPLGTAVPLPGAASFENCTAGTFADKPGQATCTQCSRGSFSSIAGATTCERCVLGMFANASGATACRLCSHGMTTLHLESGFEEECLCASGRFFNQVTGECDICGEGVRCDVPSVDIPEILAGYSAEAASRFNGTFDGHSIYKCLTEKSCPGGPAGTCASLGKGIACADCGASTFWDGVRCTKCEGAHSPWIGLVLPITFALTLTTATYIAANRSKSQELTFSVHFSIALGMMLNTGMTLSVFSHLNMEWQPPVKDVLEAFRFMTLPYRLFGGPSCTFGSDLFTSYLIIAAYPALVVLSMLVATVAFRQPTWKLMNTCGHVFYGVFALLFLQSIKPLITYSHPNGEQSVTFSPSVLVGTMEHDRALIVGMVQVFAYCATYLAVCCHAVCLLRAVRSRQGSTDSQHPDQEEFLLRYRFLFFRVKPRYYYWSLVFLLREVLIDIVPVITPELPHVQIMIMIVILSIFLLLHCVNWPYRCIGQNYADAIVQGFLLCFVASAGSFCTRSSKETHILSIALTIIFAGFFVVIGAILFVPLARLCHDYLLSKDPTRIADPETRKQQMVEEYLDMPCEVVLHVPLPSAALSMPSPKAAFEQPIVISEQDDNDQKVARTTSPEPGKPYPATARCTEQLQATLEVQDSNLRIAFSSRAFAWRAPMMQEGLEHELQHMALARKVMAAMTDGVLRLRRHKSGGFTIDWCDQKVRELLHGIRGDSSMNSPAKDHMDGIKVASALASGCTSMSTMSPLSDTSAMPDNLPMSDDPLPVGRTSARFSERSSKESSNRSNHTTNTPTSSRGHVNYEPVEGNDFNRYIVEKGRVTQFLNGLVGEGRIAHQMSTSLRKRTGEHFDADVFAAPSDSGDIILIGLKVSSSEVYRNIPKARRTALMSLQNGLLYSCSTDWNIQFRQKMTGHALMQHVCGTHDYERVTRAVERYLRTRGTEVVTHVRFRQKNANDYFEATLEITSADDQEPLDVRLTLRDVFNGTPLTSSADFEACTESSGEAVQSFHSCPADLCDSNAATSSTTFVHKSKSCPPELPLDSEGLPDEEERPFNTGGTFREIGRQGAKARTRTHTGSGSTSGSKSTSGVGEEDCWRRTPVDTVALGLMDILRHFHSNAVCCQWHAALQLTSQAVEAIKRQQCQETISGRDWQCKVCWALNEYDDGCLVQECEICNAKSTAEAAPILQDSLQPPSPAIDGLVTSL